MMTVKEYAVDVNRNVKVILDKCLLASATSSAA